MSAPGGPDVEFRLGEKAGSVRCAPLKPTDLSVVLTGASGGIGSALAGVLADAGARVLLVGRRGPPLAALAESLGADAHRTRVQALAADVTTEAGRAMIRDIAAVRGCNTLINNAALPCFGAFAAADPAQIDAVLQTNLIAPIQLTLALLPQLRAQPQARVLNIGSASGQLGMPGFAVYGAGKFGLRGFSEALRRELAGTPVRVQYLGPRATHAARHDARIQAFNARTGTRVDAPEIAAHAALVLLLSGRAEKFLGIRETLVMRINGLAPALLDPAFNPHRTALAAQEVAPQVPLADTKSQAV